MAEEEFRVNEHIVLKLEGGKTNIYIDNEFFSQCKHLLIINPLEIRELDEINSIDQVAQILSIEKEEITNEKLIITPEQEFWGHCSNMQVWVENDYDTRLIHSNLAFPLLKKLSKIGINGAEFKFKEEVFKRLEEKYAPVNNFLLREGYTYLLGDDLVLEAVLPAEECKTMRNIIHFSKERYELYIGSRSQRAKIKNGQLKSPFYFIEDNHVSHLDLILDRENKETILKETSNLSNLRSLRISVFDLGKKSINLDYPKKERFARRLQEC